MGNEYPPRLPTAPIHVADTSSAFDSGVLKPKNFRKRVSVIGAKTISRGD